MSNKILVTGTANVNDRFLQQLRDAGFEVDSAPDLLTEDELIARLQGVSGLLHAGDEVITPRVLDATTELKVVAVLAMGYQGYIDVETATKKNIVVTYTPNTLSISVAEATIGLMLDISRIITATNNFMKHGMPMDVRKMHQLAGKRLGIIGLGSIGTEIAKKAQRGFDMEVVYFSRTKKPTVEQELGIAYAELDEVLKTSDFVVVMVSDNPSTKNMIGERELGLMKETAYIINTARPKVIDPTALYNALKSKKIAGAAMDKYYVEPYPPAEDPYGLLKLPDDVFISTAHIGSLTHEARDAMAQANCDSLINILAGKDDPNIIPEQKK